MRRSALAVFAMLLLAGLPARSDDWGQWGQNAQHTGATSAVGQRALHMIDDIIYDPFVDAEKADPFAAPDLLVHYQVPLIDGNDVYMEFKSGTFTDLQHWGTQTWNEKKLHWLNNHLVIDWNFQSDWKPVPFASLDTGNGPFWEPVFHAALAGPFVYVPGFGGSIFKVNRVTGAQVARISPFGALDPNTFVAGPLTTDAAGNVYYNVMKLDATNPWDVDVVNSWLVKVSATGTVKTATYKSLTPGAPGGNDQCLGIFDTADLPWPPSPNAVPPTVPCGTQRPGNNVAPAVAPDGTIYVVSVAHLWSRHAYLIAANSNLTPKWKASLRDRFNDGCNVLLPPNGQPDGCRTGSHTGVDPAQNRPGAGRVIDDSTSSPVVAPDGSVFYGAYTRYNYAQGHMMKFSSNGNFLAAYRFGWDDTPAIYAHDGTYSLLTKDNQYGGVGSYCNDETFCPSDRTANNPAFPEAYFITRLNSSLTPEWRWQNTNTLSCSRDDHGNVTCVSDHPAGFEWCVNAPAVDRNGVVYNNSEDGGLYVIRNNGTLRDHLFLKLALGAAYTPISIAADGKVLAQNDGHLYVVGE
ncbi:MAG TPA: hypothetical protein VIA62_14740 [Thermoanaerobaculia bacterium]|nr:hypothetical protein [Thermoanaerobaculia bacterium]